MVRGSNKNLGLQKNPKINNKQRGGGGGGCVYLTHKSNCMQSKDKE